MKKTTLFVIIIIAIVITFSLFYIFSQRREKEVASLGRDQREQQINVHSTINIYDSLSHAIHVRNSLLYKNSHRKIEADALDSLTNHILHYFISGSKNHQLYFLEDDKLLYNIICRVNSNGEIENVLLDDNNISYLNDSAIINYLLSMPPYTNWNIINPYPQRELTDIMFPVRVRYR